mmetsp:Transcript_39771/g.64601  ORF Transcript_39771/g.64601 Transcript_39771/m.64601 type:complete len:132 (-) Transcript_39771:2744-3139(-)
MDPFSRRMPTGRTNRPAGANAFESGEQDEYQNCVISILTAEDHHRATFLEEVFQELHYGKVKDDSRAKLSPRSAVFTEFVTKTGMKCSNLRRINALVAQTKKLYDIVDADTRSATSDDEKAPTGWTAGGRV